MNRINGKAHGKVILIGEHAVVYGHPAIALPLLSAEVSVTINRSPTMCIDCVYHQGELNDAPSAIDNIRACIEASLIKLNKQNETFELVISSSIPQERGMGSSAAVANACVKAIFDFFNQPLSEDDRFELVQVSETLAHGTPSGLDAKTTNSLLPLYFIKDKVIEPFSMVMEGYIIVGDTGEKGQTRMAVSSLRKRKEKNPAVVNELMNQIGEYSEQARLCLQNNLIDQLGDLMDKTHQNLMLLGVSNQILNRLVNVARQSGAKGAKMTGGGWGGCMIALAKTHQQAHQIANALKRNGAAQTWILELG